MTDDEFTEYRDGRYKKAMEYYDDRANKNRFWYRACTIYILVVSVAITPILLLIISPIFTFKLITFDGRMIAAILSPTVALVASIAAHFRCHDNWLRYRATWDALQHEIHWRDAKVGEYNDSNDRNALFVERVEALISSEGSKWLDSHANKNHLESYKGKTI